MVQAASCSVSLLSAFMLLLATAGCSEESFRSGSSGIANAVKQNHPPIIKSAKIIPNPIILDQQSMVEVEAEDPDGDLLITFRHQWIVNGSPLIGETAPSLAPSMLKRGDRVAVEITAFDGRENGKPYQTQPILVGNTPPVVASVLLEPPQLVPGDRVRAHVEASDADKDNIRLTFRWWKNQSLLKEGEESDIDTTGFGVKDIIRVEVTAHDEVSKGQAVSSAPLVLGNSPPKFVSVPPTPTSREQFLYVAQAKDPDGDPITYLLETAPPGMTIDKTTGQIAWRIPTDLTGTHRVRVVVQDGQGGSSFQEFELALSSPPAAS